MATVLSGCFANPMERLLDQAAERGAGAVIEQVTGGLEEPPGFDLDALGEMPTDFPSEVPLVSTDVLSGSAVPDSYGDKIWTVKVRASGSVSVIGERIRDQFSSASWVEELWADGELAGGTFTNDELLVGVTILADGAIVGYGVAALASD